MVRNEPPSEVAKRSLTASLDYAEIRINSAAKLFGSHEDDPGLARICGTVSIPDLHDEEEPISSIDGIGLEIVEGATAEITILRAKAVVLDLDVIEDAFEVLDANSEELLHYGCLFDLESGAGLHSDLEETLAGFGGRVVIAERVRLAPAWQGLGGVGRYLFGRMLPLICCDPVVVAAQPFPLDVDRDEKGNAEKAALKRGLAQTRRIWK